MIILPLALVSLDVNTKLLKEDFRSLLHPEDSSLVLHTDSRGDLDWYATHS